MGGVSTARIIAGIVACLVVWRTGLLQTTVMLPVTVVRGVLSPLTAAQDGVEPFSIAGGVLNVTKDHMQMAQLFDDFLHSPGIDPKLEEHFRLFLARQRIRAHPTLETALDWLLQLYWIILPIVAFSIMCNMGNHKAETATSPSTQNLAFGGNGSRAPRSGAASSTQGTISVRTPAQHDRSAHPLGRSTVLKRAT